LWRVLALANLCVRARLNYSINLALEVGHQLVVAQTVLQKTKRHHTHNNGDSHNYLETIAAVESAWFAQLDDGVVLLL